MQESTIITGALLVVSFVGTFAVLKSKMQDVIERDKQQDRRIKEHAEEQNKRIVALETFMNEKTPLLDHLSRNENAIFSKLDIYGKDIVQLKQEVTQSPTMKEVRDEFVSKEMFKQLEKHMDEKFTKLEKGLDEILRELRSKNG